MTMTSYSPAPSIARRDKTIVGRMLSAILSQWPQRTRGSPPRESFLRRDIGLPPVERSRRYWDHE